MDLHESAEFIIFRFYTVKAEKFLPRTTPTKAPFFHFFIRVKL
jgi:hypothetical protein